MSIGYINMVKTVTDEGLEVCIPTICDTYVPTILWPDKGSNESLMVRGGVSWLTRLVGSIGSTKGKLEGKTVHSGEGAEVWHNESTSTGTGEFVNSTLIQRLCEQLVRRRYP